ncbi:nicotinate (nicotinamide) nucleotide adenylyltransferase [Leadbettera azotonutricia]|uniref:Probable nicotinate-nucleotide adenylyltransferase n=1 Tax=Leadbettera azotonutricia (strain ATCC BAA-888 / DSM 13862 / ZAS-9) TaxID=545695 RepID=F5Y7D5_LEAAZ|nr:nicotinate (nicotinamide) nucleotide adenylyltransferase [Leadbettera azotonutricia]AEF80934.1 nicotinate [Leadbettera azotonutricia ZAS-9]
MKAAILGGSFNPVHMGHLFLAEAVISGLGYDRIILIPAFQSPFKQGATGASPRDRLDMLAASIAGDPRLAIDDCEIKREGISYTIDTIADIKRRYCPKSKPGLILGDDLAPAFSRWHSADDIAEQADIIIAKRLFTLSNDGDSSPGENRQGFAFPYPYTALDNEIMNVSSGLVREKISANENWRYLVPAGARYIIEDRGLYGFPKPAEDGIALEQLVLIENAARNTLKPSRFLHSRSTALFARDLCLRYGLNPRAGYLAGIGHDICKSMTSGELMELARHDGEGFSEFEKEIPSLVHGRAAAVLLKDRYGIQNRDILEAVKCHVTGCAGMGPLAKVLYVADKIEVSRGYADPSLREMDIGLDELFAVVLKTITDWLSSQQLALAPETKKLLESINKERTG